MKRIIALVPLVTFLIFGLPPRLIQSQTSSLESVVENKQEIVKDVQKALKALPQARVASLSHDGIPTFIEGEIAHVTVAGRTKLAAALRSALYQIGPVFRLRSENLKLHRIDKDELNNTHVHYHQVKNGLDVIGGDLKIHLDSNGVIFAVNGTARDGFDIRPVPAITSEVAVEAARASYKDVLSAKPPRLIYIIPTSGGSMHLAYEVLVEGTNSQGNPVRDRIYIDANDGQLVDIHPEIMYALNRKIYTYVGSYFLPGTLLRSEGQGPVSDSIVNDNYDYMATAYGFYNSVYGRDSFDNGGKTITSTVHVAYTPPNAAWNGNQFAFGEGDGASFDNLALDLDITVHEFTHAVTQYGSNLFYSGEPGALNEAMSDIFAAICDAWKNGGVRANTWKIAETVYTPGLDGDALRYMDNPTADGASRDYYPERFIGIGDSGGVHSNSGIANLAFKLLAAGGTHPRNKTNVVVPAIGIERAGAIFYRANTLYLTSNSSFADARAATARAANDLYQPEVSQAVQKAWDAVGVPGGAAPPPPPTTPPNAPNNLSVTFISTSRIDLSWKDNSADENGFRIERALGSGPFVEIDRVSTNVTQYSNNGLANSTTYCYRVRAYNSAGNSAYTLPACTKTFGPLDPPAAPSNLTATASSPTTVNLKWTDNSTTEAGYKIERATGSGSFAEIARVAANLMSFFDQGLAPSTRYRYRVRAYNTGGDSAYSNLADADTSAPPSRPAAPTNLIATVISSSRIDLSWEDNSTNETGFKIERAVCSGAFSEIARIGSNVTRYAINLSTLAPGSQLSCTPDAAATNYYRVRAANNAGDSAFSNVASSTISCRGSISPDAITFDRSGGAGQINLSVLGGCTWGVSTNVNWITITSGSGNGSGVVRYSVASNPGGQRKGYITILTGHPLLVGFLIHEVTQNDASHLVTPSNLRVIAALSSSTSLSWDYSAGDFPLFIVERRTGCDSAFNIIGSLRDQTFTDNDVTPVSQSYFYRVKAVSDFGESLYSSITPEPGVASSCSGGLESMPLWMFKSKSSFKTGVIATRELQPPPLWKWANGSGTNANQANLTAATYSLSLSDLMPAGRAGISRNMTTPKDVLGNSNALESVGADYVDLSTNKIVASVASFRTRGDVYAHDYAVCSRFKGGYLSDISPILMSPVAGISSPAFFWQAKMDKSGFPPEYALIFAIYVAADERSFVVDSQWMSDQYRSMSQGYILTFQVWGADPSSTESLSREILGRIAAHGDLQYQNNKEPIGPQVFIAEAAYEYGQAKLTMINHSDTDKAITFNVVTWSAPNSYSEVRYKFVESIKPGISVIRLAMPGRLNAVLYADDGQDFVDKVYIADGHWFSFDDSGSGGTSSVSWTSNECGLLTNLTSRDLIVAGCVEMRGKISQQGWGGIARAMNPPLRPVTDVSNYQALTFFARGDGKSYRVGLETDSVARLGSADWHQFIFTAPPEGRQVVIPLSRLSQQGWDPNKLVNFTRRDIKSIVWSPIGEPLDSISLNIDKVGFTNSTIIGGTTVLPNTTDVKGPYAVNSQITDDIEVQTAALLYSVDGGHSFTRVPMLGSGKTFTASIPGQAIETEVRYYIEATDADGNVATDPADAPFSTYRFQVSRHPYLLVNDFASTSTTNALGGNSFLFGADSGGSIVAYYENQSLGLVYDVSAADSYAGYSTLLKQANLTAYNAITFQIKGATGGERVKLGLRDKSGHEHKIIVSEYLPEGITTNWQKVVMSFSTFTTVTSWNDMESVVIAFENKLGSGKSSIYLDDIKFENFPFTVPIVVDNFNDATKENGVGGSLWTSSGGGAGIHADYDTSHRNGNYGASYSISYQGISDTAWAAAGTSLLGLDASRAKFLSFYIKGDDGGEQPHIYLASGDGTHEKRAYVDIASYITVSTLWQRVDIPLATYSEKGVDLANLNYFQLVFEWKEMKGTIYIDDVRLGDITGGPMVQVVSPNTRADRWKVGTRVTISWQSSSTVGLVSHNVLLSTDGGISFTTLAKGLPGTAQSFVFNVPENQTATKKARIRIIAVDTAGNTGQDDSDENFKIKLKK